MLHLSSYCTCKLLLTHRPHLKHNGLHCHKCMWTQRSVDQGELACAIRAEIRHWERSYSTLCCPVSDIWSFVTPPPLRSHTFVAMQSIMLEMGSVGQGELACAIRAEIKHWERSFSTLCCSRSFRYLVIRHPTPLHSHTLWQCNPLCLRWGLWVKGSLHVQ